MFSTDAFDLKLNFIPEITIQTEKWQITADNQMKSKWLICCCFFLFCVCVWNFPVVVLCVNIQNDDFYLLFSLLWITNWDNWRWPFVGIVSYAYQSTILYALFFGSFELDFLKEQKKYQRFACVWILWAPIFMVMNVWMCVCGAIVVAATGNHYHCHCHCQCCSHAPYHLNPYGQRLDVTIQCLIFYIVRTTYIMIGDGKQPSGRLHDLIK